MNTQIPPQHQDVQPGIEAELITQPEVINENYVGGR